MLAPVAREQMDDLELAELQVEVDTRPQRPADMRLQDELSAPQVLPRPALQIGLLGGSHEPQPMNENLETARLVHEVKRPACKRKCLVGDQGTAGQEYDRDIDAKALQVKQQIRTRGRRQAPVQDDNVRGRCNIKRREQLSTIGEDGRREAAFREFVRQQVTIRLVVIDGDNSYRKLLGRRPRFSGGLHRSLP